MAADNVIGVRLSGDAQHLQRALNDGTGHIEGFANKARGNLRGVGAETDRLNGSFDALSHGMKSAFIGSSVAVGLIAMKNMVADVGRELIATQIASDKMRNGLNFAVGAGNAGREMTFISHAAQTLGLELVSASEQYMKLAAAAKGTALEGQATRDIFIGIGQASTVMGMSAQNTEGALRAVGQMISKNTIMSEELKGQLSEHLNGGFQIAARAMGVTTEQLNKMLETGQVVATDFLPKFAAELTKTFGPQMAESVKSMQVSVNLMANAWTNLKRNVNESGVGAAVQAEVAGMGNYVQSVSDAMDRARQRGSGTVMQFSAALGEIIARAPFDVLSVASNTLNGSLNFLSMGTLKLNTSLNLLPVSLDTNARRTEALAAALPGAVAEMARLEKQLAKVPDNIYLKSEVYQLQLFIQKAKEAKAEQDKLRGMAAEDPTRAGVRASGQAREAYNRSQNELAADLLGIKQKLAGVDKDYLPTLEKLQAARAGGLLAETEYVRLVSELANKNFHKSPATAKRETGNPYAAEQEAMKEWEKAMLAAEAAYSKATAKADDLSESERVLRDYMASSAATIAEKLVPGTTAMAKARFEAAIAIEKANASSKELEKTRSQEVKTLQDSTDAMVKKAMGIEDEIALYGMSQEAIKNLTITRLNDQLAEEKNNPAMVAAIEARIAAVKRLAKAQDTLKFKDDSAKATFETWKRGWEETDRLARDAFTGWAENGTSMAEAIGKSLKRALLSAIYEATIRPLAFQLYTSIAGGAPGGGLRNGLDAAGSVANGVSGLNTLWGAGAQFMTGATAGSSALALGSANAVGAVGGDALGALIAGNGGWAGVGVAAEAGAATAATAGATAGASSVLAAIPGWGWAALGAAALFSLFGNDGPKVQGTGSATTAFDSAGTTTARNTFGNSFDFQTADADKFVAGLQSGYLASAKALGISVAGGTFGFGSNDSDGGKFGVGARVGSANYSSTDVKTTPEAMQLEASRAVFAALQGSALPKYLSGVFDGITATTATQDQINSALTYAQNIKTLHGQFEQLPFQNLKDLSLAATKGLIEFSGGLDKLGTNLQGYYQNYYSAEEQRAQTITNITRVLNDAGATLVDADVAAATKETFRAMVEGQDLATDAGRKNYAALLSVQGAFAGLTSAATESAAALDAAARASEARANAEAWANEGRRVDAAYAALDSLRSEATQKYIDAQLAVTEAQKNLASVLHTSIKGFQDFLDNLDGARTPTARLAGARKSFDDLTARAQAGDTAAMGQLTSSAKTFLDLSKGYSASITDYRRDEARVRLVLQQGIAAGQKQLLALPKDMQAASDPLKDAYDALAKASRGELDARTLAIAMQAKLSSAESSLADRYMDALNALPHNQGEWLKTFYDTAKTTIDNALLISTAAAVAAQKILAGMYNSAWVNPATGSATLTGAAPTGTAPANTITAQPGASTVLNPVQALLDSTAGSVQTIGLSDPTYDNGKQTGGTLTPGNSIAAGKASFDSTLAYQGSSDVSHNTTQLFKDGIGRVYTSNGVQYGTTAQIASYIETRVGQVGKENAILEAAVYGITGAGLDVLRKTLPSASFAVGIDNVPYDMTARIHKGEKILPAADNRELMARLSSPQGNNTALAAEVKLLRAQNDTLGRELGAALAQIALYLRGTADSTDRIRQLEEKWDARGLPPERAAL